MGLQALENLMPVPLEVHRCCPSDASFKPVSHRARLQGIAATRTRKAGGVACVSGHRLDLMNMYVIEENLGSMGSKSCKRCSCMCILHCNCHMELNGDSAAPT
eukprot:1156869-Pelagomonas_calceolata.AAC.6